MRNWQEGRNLGFEQPDEFCVHVFVFVGYVEADDPLVRKVLPELGVDLSLCAFSMTKMISAHSTNSGVNGLSASWFVPAESHSIPGWLANICSAVGLRRRFWLQMKRTRFTFQGDACSVKS